MIAVAVPIAAILYLIVVLFIGSIDRKRGPRTLAFVAANSRTNMALLIFSAGFFAVTILSGARGTYGTAYLEQWMVVLKGSDPWQTTTGFADNAYGPLFNALAISVWISP